MSISLSEASLPAFEGTLKALKGILIKAEADCAARKIDPAVMLGCRLYPDMYPLLRQVQLACDFAKGAGARLAGVEVPKHEDSEKTFEDLRARIDKTLAFLATCDRASIDAAEEREIVLSPGGREMRFSGKTYFGGFALPNFYFHVTTAYAILRHNGAPLGKMDFFGMSAS